MIVPKDKINIRDCLSSDAGEIAHIYNHYITGTIITFEEQAISGSEVDRRMQAVQALGLPWLVAEREGKILGYAYADQWKGRSAYRFATEVTVYVHPYHVGCGIGLALYNRLLPNLKDRGVHVAIGGIALPNDASVGLHEKSGFVKAAHFVEVGYKFSQWIDVGYWLRIL